MIIPALHLCDEYNVLVLTVGIKLHRTEGAGLEIRIADAIANFCRL